MRGSKRGHRLDTWCWIPVLLAWGMAEAQVRESAGIVLMANGQFIAEHANESVRSLQRKSPIYVGDLLKLEGDGKAQVRFRDGALVSLSGGTEIQIDSFSFSETAATTSDQNIITLLKGGFRTLTGAVAKRNRDAHRVNTPVATIGVRGTNYSVALDTQLYVGVWDGAVEVRNEAGALAIGQDQAFSYAVVSSMQQSPQGLVTAPPVLTSTVTLSKAEPTRATGSSPPSSNTAANSKAGTSPVEESTGDVSKSETSTTVDSEGGVTVTDDKNGDGETLADFGLVSDGQLLMESGLTDTTDTNTFEFVDGVSGDLGGTILLSDTKLPELTDVVSIVTEARLSATEEASLTRWGLGTVETAAQTVFFSGRASPGFDGLPILTDNGLTPVDTSYDTTLPAHVVRGSTTNLTTFSDYPLIGVTLGQWTGSVSDPIIDQVNSVDASDTVLLDSPLWWITADATDPSSFSGFTSMTYRNVVAFLGGSAQGNVSTLYPRVEIDFASGTVKGAVFIHVDNGDAYEVFYTGNLSGNLLNLSMDTSQSHVFTNQGQMLPVDGDIDVVVAGSQGDSVGATFNLFATQAGVNGDLHDISGVWLADQIPVGDRRLSATEMASVDRLGAAVGPFGMVSGKATFVTPASGGASGTPIFVDGDMDQNTGLPTRIMKVGGAIVGTPTSVTLGTKAIDWGMWDGSSAGSRVFLNGDDPQIFADINGKIFWITAEPTELATLNALQTMGRTGTWVGTVTQFQGQNEAGTPLSFMSHNSTVNFATGAITNTSLTIGAGPQSWNVAMKDGTLNVNNYELTANPAGSTLSGVALTDNSVDGTLSSIITGSGGNGIAGSFNIRSVENPTIHVDGTFLHQGTVQ